MFFADTQFQKLRRGTTRFLMALGTCVAFVNSPFAFAQAPQPRIAIAVSATGAASPYASPALDGAQLALEEANKARRRPHIELSVYDDRSDPEGAREIARQVIATDAIVVVGPATTAMSLAAGPLYAEAGLVSIGTTATGDGVRANATTFQASFTTSDGGEAAANYLRHVLGGSRAIVVFRNDGYGLPVAAGFRRIADRLGITAAYRPFATDADIGEIARVAAADPAQPAIILGTLDQDAAAIVKAMRRQGAKGPILGTGAIAGEFFAALFANEPEERERPGYFTDGIYAAPSEIFDSANAETLAFAERFRARFGHDANFYAVQGYEAMRLAVAAVRATAAKSEVSPGLRARRDAIRSYLISLNGPANGVAGLNGPLWFTPERGRQQALRMGRFHGAEFESAPTQLVPVRNPDAAEIAAGTIVEIDSRRFARRQQVVYTGVFLNEIPQVDIAQSTFTADFYLWMRFARTSGAGASNPTEINFPGIVHGPFDAGRLAAQGDLDDGTTYRLWQVRADIKNDFDLRAYPFDRQTLVLRFFNPGAASDRIVYIRDHRSISDWSSPVQRAAFNDSAAQASPSARPPKAFVNTSPVAFRNLSQWEPLRASQRRDSLVTQSALGDPRLVGFERVRELSGFNVTIELRRRVLPTLAKTLLPLGLMALMMYASLYFPPSMSTPRVTVLVTGALAGTVLLASINSQLGNIGYVISVEYGFYAYFFLCLLCLIAAFLIERYRAAARPGAVLLVERVSRHLFLLGLVSTIAAAWLAYIRA